jgi:hypothetical protein
VDREPGWYKDLFYRDQDRYWDGKVWTMDARPAGSNDPTPPPGIGGPVAPAPGREPRPDAAHVPSSSAVAPAAASKRPRPALLPVLAAAVLVIGGLGGVGGVVAFGGHGDAAAAEALSQAVSSSLNRQSADVSLDATISIGGQNVEITGSGTVDFANPSGTFAISMPTGGSGSGPLTEQVVETGSTVYVGLPSLLNQILPGKSWISLDLSQYTSGTAGLNSGVLPFDDPAGYLRQLESDGSSVTALGPTSIDGTAVSEYSVSTPTSKLVPSLTGGADAGGGSSADNGLSTELQKLAQGILPQTITEQVYIAPGNLLKAIDVPLTFSVFGTSMSEDVSMTYSNYGTPVNVTPPAASQVATLQQFEAVAGASGDGGVGNSGNSGLSGNSGNTGDVGNSGLCGCAPAPPVGA